MTVIFNRWVEVWQRKRHQYLCDDKSSSEEVCYGTDDDLREAQCANRGNTSLVDAFKSDIECGWGSASQAVITPALIFLVALSSIMFS